MSSTTTTPTNTHHTMHSSTSTGGSTNNSNGSTDDGSTSRPLLFFVALGFGVVFTNLWIIVGVKYCFRYNQRARQGLIDNETGEPIDLHNMARPRRRREKKLMSMEEVNERFPLTKYKIWRATREQEGLPTAGGVTAPPSRAASIKEAIMDRPSTEHANRASYELGRVSTSSKKPNPDPSSETRDFANTAGSVEKSPPTAAASQSTAAHAGEGSRLPDVNAHLDDEDDDDPIRTAVPAELLQQPGDACAICIDTIEDEDEVRGLTCGHAFHAGCLDPWLTSRRACCPLCKADYFVPKPRPEGEAANPDISNHPLSVPPNVWIGGRAAAGFRPRLVIAGSRFTVDHNDRFGFPVLVRDNRFRQRQRPAAPPAEPEAEGAEPDTASPGAPQEAPRQSRGARLAGRLRSIPAGFRPSRHQSNETEAGSTNPSTSSEAQATPGQLEAGTR